MLTHPVGPLFWGPFPPQRVARLLSLSVEPLTDLPRLLTLPDLSLSVEPAYASFEFQISERALTMSPEKDQYIWRKTISHIEVGMGSGVFPV